MGIPAALSQEQDSCAVWTLLAGHACLKGGFSKGRFAARHPASSILEKPPRAGLVSSPGPVLNTASFTATSDYDT